MSADGFKQCGYGLVIVHRWCSDILPVDSEGRFKSHEEGDNVVPAPGSRYISEQFIRTDDEGVRFVVFIGNLSPAAALWSLRPEPLEWYRGRVEHLCLENQDTYNEIEEVTAWA